MELWRGRLLTDEEVLVLVVVWHEFLLLHTKLLKHTIYSGREDTCARTPKLPGDVLSNQASIQRPLEPWPE